MSGQSGTLPEDAGEAAFTRAAEGFAISTTTAMCRAFDLPAPAGLTQPQHCLAIMTGAVAAGAQQAAALMNHALADPEECLAALHRVLDDHFARKLTLEARGRG